nr:ATP synthase F0 subunit 8 [Saphanus piceus]
MPQMAPLNWLNLFLFFILIFFMFNINNYFMFKYNIKTFKAKKQYLFFNWKW